MVPLYMMTGKKCNFRTYIVTCAPNGPPIHADWGKEQFLHLHCQWCSKWSPNLTLSPPGVFLKMSPESPKIHLCFLQNFAVIHQMVKFDFPSRFWCHSNHHPKKIFLGSNNVSYNHIFRAHFRDEKTRAEPLTYIYVVGLTGVPLKTRIYTWLGVKGLINWTGI